MPRGNVPSHLFKQTTLTFNPWLASHWLKKRFFDNPADNVSTYSTNYLINEFLDETDRKIFEHMKETNYRNYEVAGLGNWGVTDGLVFENWQILNFEEDKLGVEDNTEWQYKRFYGLDFGYVNDPSAFVAFVANPITKELYIYDEFYECKLLNSDIATLIKRKGFAKERIRADCAEPKSIDDLRRMGISRVLPSVKGKDSILNGISQIREYKIYVHPKCENMIYELGSYCWQKDDNDNGLNKPEDTDNHLCDALRYAMVDVKFFHPTDPSIKRRLTPEERFERDNGISAEDFNQSWE